VLRGRIFPREVRLTGYEIVDGNSDGRCTAGNAPPSVLLKVSLDSRALRGDATHLVTANHEPMIARACITFDEQYFAKSYSDWLRYRSKWRKFAPLIAALLLVAGSIVVVLSTRSRRFGVVLIAIGIGYLVDVLTYKRRWIRQRLNAGGSSSGCFDFHEDRMFVKSDSGEGYYLLSGFVACTTTGEGVFLYPQKDIYFYVPWDSIEPAEAIPKVRELLISRGELSRTGKA
jgi:hypothetical protein